MKKESFFILVAAILFFLVVAIKFFPNIGHELSHKHWERAFVALVIFSVTSATSIFGFLILVFVRKKKKA